MTIEVVSCTNYCFWWVYPYPNFVTGNRDI